MIKKNNDNDLLSVPENIINQPMESEITQSYIDYAMSVIVSRALPDTRDGFKPVHRRILYAMNDMGLKHNIKYRKSMTVVGEVLGKYHPHGDSSVYEAMVRMAQDFAMRYPLVDGQGNFGSIDGDGAAASRYTEARLTHLAEYMIANIHEDTVDRRPNYDDSRMEPISLPTIFPNHLCNGTMGIAVGMATNMAPHNLTEVIDACLMMIKKVKNNDNDKFEDKGDSLTLMPEVILIDAVKTLINSDVNYDSDSWEINKELAEYLDKLPQKKIVITNAANYKLESIKEMLSSFGREIFSLENNPPKDNPDYFKIFLEKQSLSIDKYIYFDHKQENINAAQNNGIKSILYESNIQIFKDLNTYKSNDISSDNDTDIYINHEFDNVSVDDIMDIIKGPDFPTGGTIFDHENIKTIYAKGKGSILIRGKTHIESDKGIDNIIIDEIPYQVNKSTMVEKIGNLVSEKKIEGITDIVDESANNKIRVNIELRKGTNPQTILTQLYKYTDLQTGFGLNNISLVEKGLQPRLLNIKDLLVEFIVFRREVVTRRSKFQLSKANDRLHILEGLQRAIDIIDEVIALIRGSNTTEEAKENLMKKFDFTDLQAEYILKLTLGRLVGLEMQKTLDEIGEKKKLIEYLTEIINNSSRLDEVVCEEITDVKNRFGDDRRTTISDDIGDFSGNFKNLLKLQDLKKEDVMCLIDNNHCIKILYQSRIQNVPEDIIHLVNTNNQDKLIVITDIGELVIQRLKELGSWTIKQNGLDPIKQWGLKGKVILCETMEDDYDSLCFLTNQNSIKKIDKELLLKFKKFPTFIMNLGDKEKITSIVPTQANQKLGIISKLGSLVVFDEGQLRTMGKTSGGIKGIELAKGDEVTSMFVYIDEPFIMIYSDRSAKLINVDDIKFHRRGHKGQLVVSLQKNEKILGAHAISEGNIRVKLSNDEIKTIHNDNMKLDDLDTPMEAITNLAISMVYIPWEEKTAAKKAKLAKISETTGEDNDTTLFQKE